MLTDPTGSRRYLCSKVTFIDYEHTVNIDGAMAQARALYQSGFKYWFDQEEINELTATQIAIVLMEKAKILLNDHTVSKLGKIMTKQEYLRIRVKNSYYYLVRILESDVIDRDKHSLGEAEAQKAEQEANEQIIRFEEDLFNTSKGDGLPF
jgi:predicted P-loop ATPase